MSTEVIEENIPGKFEIEMQTMETEKQNLLSETINENTPVEGIKPVSIFRLAALTISFLGVQFGCERFINYYFSIDHHKYIKGALQVAFTSPLFLELGVPKGLVSFVWLAGPISGIIKI